MSDEKTIANPEVEIISITSATANKLSGSPVKSNFFIIDILVKEKDLVSDSYFRTFLNGSKIIEVPTVVAMSHFIYCDNYGCTTMKYPQEYCGIHFTKMPRISTNNRIRITVDDIPESQIVIWKIDLNENVENSQK